MTFLADIAADRAAFLADFGETVTYTAYGAAPASITAIFDDASKLADLDMGGVRGTEPQLLCSDADIPNISKRDTFTVRSVLYKVKDIQPDGTGMTVVIL